MRTKSVQLAIHGRVHGVGFRAWLSDEAEERELSGWVRNRRDGTVEALLSGDETMVDELVARCRQGPRAAIVFELKSGPYDGLPPIGFKILPTA